MPSGAADRLARGAGDPERPHRQPQLSAAAPGFLRDQPDQFVERRDFTTGKDVGAAADARHLAAEPKPFDQVIDVGQVIEDPAVAEDDEATARDAAKEFQQPLVTGTVDAGRPRDDDLDAGRSAPPRAPRASPSSFVSW